MTASPSAIQNLFSECTPYVASGKLIAARGTTALAQMPGAAIGDICYIKRRNGSSIRAEIVSFEDDFVHLAPFERLDGIFPGSEVINSHQRASINIPCDSDLQNTVLNASGDILRSKQTSSGDNAHLTLPIYTPPPCALSRKPIEQQLYTGVPLIDILFPIGYGQRLGLLAGPGVGKSTLLGQLAKTADVDFCVVGLIGERGREVQEFIEESLGEAGMAKSSLIISTSDESSVQRKMAAQTATAIAEYHRDRGKRVLLLIDSLTRTARAIREIGLSSGESPVRHGYTASVFTELPTLLERTGMGRTGSITALYTLLSSSEHDVDPLADEVKSLLDGHLVLSSKLASMRQYPAIDPLQSISRLCGKLQEDREQNLSASIMRTFVRLAQDRDTVLLGGIADDELQGCMDIEERLNTLLRSHCPAEEQSNRWSQISELLESKGLMRTKK